jgi:hypothetical protein
MLLAPGAELGQLQPLSIVLFVFGSGIVSLLARAAGEMDNYSIFTFFSHITL